ncbi:Sodium/potassium-transporting ATPase subunit beta-1 [Dufourea novaeangliae]|uniref:Sodium/potassium-transporting ATPase subunit beta-1 n=1 Tax=Dufourea novaeangliae TaxID=178035 RepID=A0A154NZQ9_DUFNO|nr:Sodium/potassium-transporting ATPase subunit beta-1 [Dufourea novaeangliae]
MVILHDDKYYESRIPQPDLGAFGNILRFIWNKKRKAFLGRTGKEWAQLGLFYLCFFSVLGAIFALQMKISVDFVSKLDKPFFQYTDPATRSILMPKYFNSLRKFGSPGIAFKPRSISASSPIISVNNSSIKARPKRYIQALTDFLREYNANVSKYNVNCQHQNYEFNRTRRPCFFDTKSLGVCSRYPYGYSKPLKPCVLVKFNKRFDWVPDYYNQSSRLPKNMPNNLKMAIQSSEKFYIWLSCDGANSVDKEHIGEIDYIPSPGFPIEYFPFTGQQDYLSPIVALHFQNLTPNRLVTVECNLWAFNIEQRSHYSLDFQIIIDDW